MDEATKEAIGNLKENQNKNEFCINELYGMTRKNENKIIEIINNQKKCAMPTEEEITDMKEEIKIAKKMAAARKMTAKDWVLLAGIILTFLATSGGHLVTYFAALPKP